MKTILPAMGASDVWNIDPPWPGTGFTQSELSSTWYPLPVLVLLAVMVVVLLTAVLGMTLIVAWVRFSPK